VAFLENSPDTLPEKRTGFTFRGKEIVLSKVRGAPTRGRSYKKPGSYPDEKRIEVATLYACLGDPAACSDLSKVPIGTVKSWTKTPWFKLLLEEIRQENNEKLDAKFTQIVDKSQDLIIDRLENGDFHVLRDGSQVRKPINAKELAIVGAVTFDKRQIARNKPTSISQSNQEGVVSEDKLKLLAKTFLELVNKKETPVIEGDFKEIDDEVGPNDPVPSESGTQTQ